MRFTIGLPITKSEFLGETLESISKQSFTDYELIIRNNAKTPELKNKIKELCSPWLEKPNVTYLESKRQCGMIENFNVIINQAKGDYFTMLSDDDVMHFNFLEEFNNLIYSYPTIHVFHCRTRHIDEASNFIDYADTCPAFETFADFLFHRLIGSRKTTLSDFVVSTKALKLIGGFSPKIEGYGSDTFTWYRLGANGVAYTPKVLLDYRINRLSYTNDPKKLLIRLNDIKKLKAEVEKLILSENFRKRSSFYSTNYLLKKNEEAYRGELRNAIYWASQRLNLLSFVQFYLNNHKKYSFPFKLLLKYSALKLNDKMKIF